MMMPEPLLLPQTEPARAAVLTDFAPRLDAHGHGTRTARGWRPPCARPLSGTHTPPPTDLPVRQTLAMPPTGGLRVRMRLGTS